jgi:7-cyano-7-deazaguanine synthase
MTDFSMITGYNSLMNKKAVVLLSGGLDSTTCLAIAKDAGFKVYALTINYGQRHDFELNAANQIIDHYNIKDHSIVDIDLSQFGGSALTDDIEIPKDRNENEMSDIPVTYVPARNTVFLSLGLAWAETLEAYDIFIGVNALDYSGYPDCRPEYISAFEKTANLATRAGVSGNTFRIHTPLINMTKSEIISIGLQLGVDYGLTSTCYDPRHNGDPCGHCDACLLRLKGFEESGNIDPLNYSDQ